MTEAASGYERQDLEKYFTPAWVTDALLPVGSFSEAGTNVPTGLLRMRAA